MAKMTLLEMVQDILNDIDGDEVNSISDTFESEQIAQIIKTTYDAMIRSKDWPHTKGLLQLVASGTTAKPTHMTFDEDFKRIVYINYNKIKVGETRIKYEPVRFMNSDDFLRMVNSRDSTASNISSVVDDSGITLLIRNDMAPSYFTSFDDETLVFDSYDSAVDSTLQVSKTQCVAFKIPDFVISDAVIPDLPSEAFILLLEESKSRVSMKLRQQEDVKSELESRKQGQWLSKQAWTVNGGIKYDNYGRNKSRTRKTSRETSQ